MKICLVETYYGGSHRAWAEGFSHASQHDVTLVTLSDENWRWRMRGGALQVMDRIETLKGAGYRPDILLVSDMIDLGLFMSLIHPMWGRPPVVLFAHENQMSYPSQKGTDPGFGFINWTSALVADQVWFNSRYHRDTFFDAVPEMLARFPDGPHTGELDSVVAKSRVSPVGVELLQSVPVPEGRRLPRILWNHRWEHDKRPYEFTQTLIDLASQGFEFEVALCGEEPLGGDQLRDSFIVSMGDRLVCHGHLSRSEYVAQIGASDIVVSTAIQENFGISVVEAISAGLCPVLPDRLSYPELITDEFSEVLYGPDGFATMLGQRLSDPARARALGRRMAPKMARFGWAEVGPIYDRALSQVLEGSPITGPPA